VTFDLVTLAAQIVNFVVLLALLRVFLYGPVRRVMRRREQRIAEDREAARRAREEAEREKERLASEREELERRRRQRERELDDEIAERREARLEEVEEAAREARRALADAIERERDEALATLRRRSAELLADEVRRALDELADASLERRAAVVFRRRLAELDEERREELRRAHGDGPVRIAGAFEPDDAVREELTGAVQELLGEEVDPTFERDPELGFGVALQVGGVRVGWTAQGYAQGLEEAFDHALAELRGRPVDAPADATAETADADG
jgi:F-type H+-transporting ATPase subunit b